MNKNTIAITFECEGNSHKLSLEKNASAEKLREEIETAIKLVTLKKEEIKIDPKVELKTEPKVEPKQYQQVDQLVHACRYNTKSNTIMVLERFSDIHFCDENLNHKKTFKVKNRGHIVLNMCKFGNSYDLNVINPKYNLVYLNEENGDVIFEREFDFAGCGSIYQTICFEHGCLINSSELPLAYTESINIMWLNFKTGELTIVDRPHECVYIEGKVVSPDFIEFFAYGGKRAIKYVLNTKTSKIEKKALKDIDEMAKTRLYYSQNLSDLVYYTLEDQLLVKTVFSEKILAKHPIIRKEDVIFNNDKSEIYFGVLKINIENDRIKFTEISKEQTIYYYADNMEVKYIENDKSNTLINFTNIATNPIIQNEESFMVGNSLFKIHQGKLMKS